VRAVSNAKPDGKLENRAGRYVALCPDKAKESLVKGTPHQTIRSFRASMAESELNAFADLLAQAGLRSPRTSASTGKDATMRETVMKLSFHSLLRHTAVSLVKTLAGPLRKRRPDFARKLIGH
jgi:hypothetical protein